MKKINEIAEITGLTKRALRYYDQIGLLKPSEISESGYRLYDDEALETVQQILFFKEIDVPLKEIQSILSNPNFDKLSMLKKQKQLITLKRDRLNNILALIDKNIKGEKNMSFTEFEMKSIEKAFKETLEVDFENMQGYVKDKFKDKNELIEKIMNSVKNNPSIVYDYFNNVNNFVSALKKETDKEALAEYKNKQNEILIELGKNQNKDISDMKVQKMIDDLQKLNEDFYKTNSVGYLRDLYKCLLVELEEMDTSDVTEEIKEKARQNCQKLIDIYEDKYGKGSADFIGRAIKYYCEHK